MLSNNIGNDYILHTFTRTDCVNHLYNVGNINWYNNPEADIVILRSNQSNYIKQRVCLFKGQFLYTRINKIYFREYVILMKDSHDR